MITKLVLRKGQKLTSFAFEVLFSRDLPHLTYLNLDECQEIEDPVLELISKNCKNLEKFSLHWCSKIGNIGIENLLIKCLKLKKLDLAGHRRLTDECLEEALKREGEGKRTAL